MINSALLILATTVIFTGVTATGFESDLIVAELDPLAIKLSGITGFERREVLNKIFGDLDFIYHKTDGAGYSCWSSLHCYGSLNPLAVPNAKGLLIHELGHRFLNDLGFVPDMRLGYVENGVYIHVAGINPKTGLYERTPRGYPHQGAPYEQHGCLSPDYHTYREDFADWFMNWALNQFTDDQAGRLRYEWMDAFVRSHISYKPRPNRARSLFYER